MAYHEQDANGRWWYVWGVHDTRTQVFPQVCECCSKDFLPGSGKRRRFCGRVCAGRTVGGTGAGPGGTRWKGGRRIDKRSGYVLVWIPADQRTSTKKYVSEHRLVMEEALGRKLRTDERVHHINGVKHDNRSENLRIVTPSEHARLHIKGIVSAEPPHCPTCTCSSH